MLFIQKLQAIQLQNRSAICLPLNVRIDKMPLPMARIDDPMFPFARSIIDATQDLVCAYSIDLAYYLSEAAAGMIALERITRYIPDNIPIIFDAKFGELGDSADRYAVASFEAFRADAVTFGSMPSDATIDAFLKFEGKTIFLPSNDLQATIKICETRSNGGCGIWIGDESAIQRISAREDIPMLVSAHNEMGFQAIKNFRKSHPLSIVELSSSVLYESRREDYVEAVRSAVAANRHRTPALARYRARRGASVNG